MAPESPILQPSPLMERLRRRHRKGALWGTPEVPMMEDLEDMGFTNLLSGEQCMHPFGSFFSQPAAAPPVTRSRKAILAELITSRTSVGDPHYAALQAAYLPEDDPAIEEAEAAKLQFPSFCLLPPEIRVHIWRLAACATRPRSLTISRLGIWTSHWSPDTFDNRLAMPHVAYTCREALAAIQRTGVWANIFPIPEVEDWSESFIHAGFIRDDDLLLLSQSCPTHSPGGPKSEARDGKYISGLVRHTWFNWVVANGREEGALPPPRYDQLMNVIARAGMEDHLKPASKRGWDPDFEKFEEEDHPGEGPKTEPFVGCTGFMHARPRKSAAIAIRDPYTGRMDGYKPFLWEMLCRLRSIDTIYVVLRSMMPIYLNIDAERFRALGGLRGDHDCEYLAAHRPWPPKEHVFGRVEVEEVVDLYDRQRLAELTSLGTGPARLSGPGEEAAGGLGSEDDPRCSLGSHEEARCFDCMIARWERVDAETVKSLWLLERAREEGLDKAQQREMFPTATGIPFRGGDAAYDPGHPWVKRKLAEAPEFRPAVLIGLKNGLDKPDIRWGMDNNAEATDSEEEGEEEVEGKCEGEEESGGDGST